MTLTVTDDFMSSDLTRHIAIRRVDGWTVTWLPGRVLDRNTAITAMTLAEYASRGVGLHDDPAWPHIESWAAELGLSGADAVGKASEPPGEDGTPRPLSAWCRKCRRTTLSVPCPSCDGPACAWCGRCPPCDDDSDEGGGP